LSGPTGGADREPAGPAADRGTGSDPPGTLPRGDHRSGGVRGLARTGGDRRAARTAPVRGAGRGVADGVQLLARLDSRSWTTRLRGGISIQDLERPETSDVPG